MKTLALILSFFLLASGSAFGQHGSAEQKQREKYLLTLKLAELRIELSQLLVLYGTNHPAVKKVQSEIDDLQKEKELDQQKSPERDWRCSQPQCGATVVPIIDANGKRDQ